MERVRALWEATLRYAREVRGELRRVVWPDRRQAVVLTSVVIFSSGVVSLIIWAFDKLVSSLMLLLMGK